MILPIWWPSVFLFSFLCSFPFSCLIKRDSLADVEALHPWGSTTGIVHLANKGSIRTLHYTIMFPMFIYMCSLRLAGLLNVPSLPPLFPKKRRERSPYAELTRTLLYQKIGGAAATWIMRQQLAETDSPELWACVFTGHVTVAVNQLREAFVYLCPHLSY